MRQGLLQLDSIHMGRRSTIHRVPFKLKVRKIDAHVASVRPSVVFTPHFLLFFQLLTNSLEPFSNIGGGIAHTTTVSEPKPQMHDNSSDLVVPQPEKSLLAFPFASLSSTTSVLSEAFVKILSNWKANNVPLASKVSTAKSLIKKLALSPKNAFNCGGFTLSLHGVLEAMLLYADSCGGEGGTNYTASAVIACVVKNDPVGEETLDMLCDLAITWVTRVISYSYVSIVQCLLYWVLTTSSQNKPSPY